MGYMVHTVDSEEQRKAMEQLGYQPKIVFANGTAKLPKGIEPCRPYQSWSQFPNYANTPVSLIRFKMHVAVPGFNQRLESLYYDYADGGFHCIDPSKKQITQFGECPLKVRFSPDEGKVISLPGYWTVDTGYSESNLSNDAEQLLAMIVDPQVKAENIRALANRVLPGSNLKRKFFGDRLDLTLNEITISYRDLFVIVGGPDGLQLRYMRNTEYREDRV